MNYRNKENSINEKENEKNEKNNQSRRFSRKNCFNL